MFRRKIEENKMSDLFFSEDHHLINSAPVRIAELFSMVDEVMERSKVLGKEAVRNLSKVDDDHLLFIFTNQSLWLERVELLNNSRYKTISYLNYVKNTLSPEIVVEIRRSVKEAELLSQEIQSMLDNVEKTLKQRNVSLVPDYTASLISMINSMDKPTYGGGTLPHVHTFMMEVKKYFETIKIPLVLQGSFIRRNFLSDDALRIVESSLPIGTQASREEIFNILERNFGNAFLILKSLKKEHESIGPIPSYSHDGHSHCDWKNISASCQKHMQVIFSLEDLLYTQGDHVLNMEYLTYLKHILPQQIIFTVSVLLEEKTSLRDKLDVIKSEIIKLERVSTQCFVEEQALDLPRNTTISIPRDNLKTPTLLSNEKHQHGAFKLSVCRVCKLLIPGSNLTPTLHRVTKTGFLIKDQCPHLSTLPHSERSGLLVRNKICRACLSVRADTAGHGPEGSCKYLSKKKLLHLKCKMPGCDIRQSLCTIHSYQDHLDEESRQGINQVMSTGTNDSYSGPCAEGEGVSAVTMEKADGVERQTLETRSSKSDCLQDVSNQGSTNHALHEMFTIRTVSQENEVEAKNEGHIDSIKDNNSIRSEYHEENVTDYILDVEASHYEEGTIASEMVAIIRKTLRRQGKGMHKTAYSNVSTTRGIVDTCHKGYRSFQRSNNLFQNSQEILADFKVRQSDPNASQAKNAFERAEDHGLNLEYSFKIFLSKGLSILFDTGQAVFQ